MSYRDLMSDLSFSSVSIFFIDNISFNYLSRMFSDVTVA